MQLTAKPTRYKGILFRSALESRWASFLDQLGVRWQYEPKVFKVTLGGYLPDFYFPALKMWAEVKPGPLDKEAMMKIMDVVVEAGENALLLEGPPHSKVRMVKPCMDMQSLDSYRGLVLGDFDLTRRGD